MKPGSVIDGLAKVAAAGALFFVAAAWAAAAARRRARSDQVLLEQAPGARFVQRQAAGIQ